ncbi:MAG TPA: hypothetical protein VFS58_07835 [Steroidobacteraceae bacterium]|nr:hypothetical protein [Steroidobacteraceae bacterium]
MRPSNPYLRVFATLLLVAAFAAHAADKPKKVKYAAPDGFGGHQWGELLTSSDFAQVQLEPIGVGAAWMRPVEKDLTFTCMPVGGMGAQMGGALGGCDFQATLNSLRRTFEGGGFYVLSEYTIEAQGARYGGEKDGIVLHPVIYQFCANWDSTKREVPPKFDELNQFCGVRMMFESETREELRNLPADHVTNYDRVLDKLIARFGKPDKFARRGQVIIETLEGDSTDRKERKFGIWRWCPARDRGLHTSCTASVVLSLEPATGVATVLYSTPLLWEFAYARQNNGFKGDKLFKLLHARK